MSGDVDGGRVRGLRDLHSGASERQGERDRQQKGALITQRELLMEMREDIKGLKVTVDVIAKDQALGVERRAAMQRSADSIYERLDGHDRDLDRMLAWQNRADWALVLARWALGASLVSLVAVALQVLATVGHAMTGGIP